MSWRMGVATMMRTPRAASALVYLERGQVLVSLVGPIALGVLGGAAIGTRLLPKLTAATIRAWFVVVLGLIVVQMLYQGLTR